MNTIILTLSFSDNVLIRTREDQEPGEVHEVIEYVWFMSCLDDSPDSGQVMSRLFALGKVLHNLFTMEEPPSTLPSNLPIDSISFKYEDTSSRCPQSTHQSSSQSNEVQSFESRQRSKRSKSDNIFDSEELKNANQVPWSISFLLKNLLDNGNLSDEAYTSFASLQSDIQLMISDPTRFVDDIEGINSGNDCARGMAMEDAFEIRDKLYGREDEVAKVERSYQQFLAGRCRGIIINGRCGVGKSMLALNTEKINDGYFVSGKFEQNKGITQPLSAIRNLFNSLCDVILQRSSQTQLMLLADALKRTLGNQAELLARVVPSLTKLLPSCRGLGQADDTIIPEKTFIDSTLRVRNLFGELLSTLAAHSEQPISLFLDDLQVRFGKVFELYYSRNDKPF